MNHVKSHSISMLRYPMGCAKALARLHRLDIFPSYKSNWVNDILPPHPQRIGIFMYIATTQTFPYNVHFMHSQNCFSVLILPLPIFIPANFFLLLMVFPRIKLFSSPLWHFASYSDCRKQGELFPQSTFITFPIAFELEPVANECNSRLPLYYGKTWLWLISLTYFYFPLSS